MPHADRPECLLCKWPNKPKEVLNPYFSWAVVRQIRWSVQLIWLD